MSPRAFQRSVLAFLFLFVPGVARAEDTWREVRSPHFRVLTNSSEANGRAVAFQFEQMRHVFTTLLGREDIEDGAPLTIVAARDGNTLRQLEPALWKTQGDQVAGEFHRGWEKQFALTRFDTWEGQNQVVIYHEYTHSILHANTLWLPVWLDEGLAEFYAYTRFEKDRTLIGAPSMRSSYLGAQRLIPLAEMMQVTPNSPEYRDDPLRQLFYAQSWAMVHYMIFGPGMQNGQKLAQFMKKIGDLEPQEQAFSEVFGNPKTFQSNFASYVLRSAFTAGVIAPDPRMDAKSFTARQLTPGEATYELACFHLGAHDRTTAHAMLEAALKLDPRLAGAEEELGYAAFEEGDHAEAQRHWKAALNLDPGLPRSNFALIMSGKPLADQTPEELSSTQIALRHVTVLAPRFAPAYVELALTEWRLGNLNQAYKDAHTAEAIEPARAGYRVLAGRILLQGKQPAMAADTSRYVADHWFGADHNEAVDLWNDVPVEDRGPGPAPAFSYPSAAQTVRGRLTAIACPTRRGEKFSVTLQPDGANAASLTLTGDTPFTSGFSDTLWWGEDHFSLCHNIVGEQAVIAYKPRTDHRGTLLSFEIRDDLPPSTAAPVQHGTTSSPAPSQAPAPTSPGTR